MRKTLLLAIALLFSLSVFSQENIYIINESFDGSTLPQGWTKMGSGTNNWYISTSNIAGGKPNELHLQWTPPFNGIARFVSPTVDLSDVSSAIIALKHYPSFFGSHTATVGVATSSDNGNTWNTVWSDQYSENGQYTILENITSPDMGKSSVKFCFYFEGNSNHISSWYFDDFEVYTVEDLGVELTSIDVPSTVKFGLRPISFTIKNSGSSPIESMVASYTINGETEQQTFFANVPSMESKEFTFSSKYNFAPGEDYNISVEISKLNDSDEELTDVVLSKEIASALSQTQRTPMIEHFSSSTCGPCVAVNTQMAALTENHEGQYTYTKYTSNGPGLGDPYFTAEGGARMTYYNVLGVPQTFLNGIDQGYNAISEDNFTASYNEPAFADVRGTFNIEGNTINIKADFMSYFNMENVRAFITVNETTTTGNVASNGETEFHHVMMKMLEDAEGNTMNINAGEYQHLEFSFDMSSTFVEEMNDLEVALWLQNYETKEIYNSHYAYENNEHVYPVRNMSAEINGSNLKISWNAPETGNPTGYNVYVNGELEAENVNALEYTKTDANQTHKTAEVVAVYENGTSVAVAKIITAGDNVEEIIADNINIYPNPTKDFVKLNAHGTQLKTIKVYNCLGMMIEEIEVNANEVEINISGYNSGIYFINIETENGNQIQKVLKK
ncbi:MAG: T9SS type A sorting domain-containing protein [Bacteroidales bacterium]|nr:T9SS type A sorting domain-containing protein [Bacteroidales bacterium]